MSRFFLHAEKKWNTNLVKEQFLKDDEDAILALQWNILYCEMRVSILA